MAHDACVYAKFNHAVSFHFLTLNLFGRRVVVVNLRLSVHLSVRPPARPFPSFLLTRKLNQFNLPNLQSGSSMALPRMV